jgi:hypothetical protein
MQASEFELTYVTERSKAGNLIARCPCGNCNATVTETTWLTFKGKFKTDTKVKCSADGSLNALTKRPAVLPVPLHKVERQEPLVDTAIQCLASTPVTVEKKLEAVDPIAMSFDLAAGEPLLPLLTPEEKKQRKQKAFKPNVPKVDSPKKLNGWWYDKESDKFTKRTAGTELVLSWDQVKNGDTLRDCVNYTNPNDKTSIYFPVDDCRAYRIKKLNPSPTPTRGRGNYQGRGGRAQAPSNEIPVTSPVAPSRGGRGGRGKGNQGRKAPASTHGTPTSASAETPAVQTTTVSDDDIQAAFKSNWAI